MRQLFVRRRLPVRFGNENGRLRTLLPARLQRGITLVELLIGLAVIAVLSAIAIPQFVGYQQKAIAQEAVMGIVSLQGQIESFRTEFGRLPLNLAGVVDPVPNDPWGNPYQYLNLEAGLPGTNGKRRRDKNMNPVNSDFDLYSKGPDGISQAQFNAPKARDDVVRAADGDFIGIAEDF